MNNVTLQHFFSEVRKYDYEVVEETDNEHSYDSYVDKATGREIGYIEFHSDKDGPIHETYHLWNYGI